jgi:hypothetical protein
MFNIYLGIFIIVAIAVIVGGSFKVYNGSMTIGAIIFFIGALVVFIVFGTNWFKSGSIFSKTPVPWPTTINTCPDYLVYYGRKMTDGTTQPSCIDTIGVSRTGALKLFPKSGVPPSGDEHYFSLVTKSSSAAAKNAELCQRAITFGLTWEGITNGESCVTPAGPVAPGGGGSGANCPPQ